MLERGEVRDYPLTIRHVAGRRTDVLYNATTYLASDGSVAGIFAAARDITERRRAEAALREAAAYARGLIEASLDPLVTISPGGQITDVNRATELVTGVPRERLVGTDFADAFTEPERARAGYRQVLERGLVRDYPLTIRGADGRCTDVLYNATTYLAPDGRIAGVFAAARDITERRRAEAAQREAAAYARGLIEASLDPLVTISPEGKITDVNRATELVTGVPRERLVGTDFADAFTEPERARVGYRLVLERGEVRDYPLTIRGDGGRGTAVLYNAATYRALDGTVAGVFAAARDVTALQRAEAAQRALLARTTRAERTAALGTMSAGMSHEINNPLTYVLAGVTYAREQLRALPPAYRAAWPDAEGGLAALEEALDEAAEGAERVRALVADLRAFASGQHDDHARCDLAAALDRAARVARHAFGNSSVLTLELPALPLVSGSQAELVQLFCVLLVNAAQAKGAGPNEIRVTAERRDEAVVVRVTDTGVGIPAEHLPLVFEPFFTTRAIGQGKGLGLSVALGLVQGLGGRIEVESVLGKGTVVSVALPVAAAA